MRAIPAEPARNRIGPRIPSFLVQDRLLDGIVWVGLGVALLVQAGFLAALGYWFDGPVAPDRLPGNVASAVVAVGFVLAGLGALTLGARGITAARRRR